MKRKQFNIWMQQLDQQLNHDIERRKQYNCRPKTTSKPTTKRKKQKLSQQQQDQENDKQQFPIMKLTGKNTRQMLRMKQENQIMRIKQCVKNICQTQSQILKTQLASKLANIDPIFKKLQYSLLQTIVFLSKINSYPQKTKVNRGTTKKIGFILYGSIFIYNKDYQAKIQRGGTIGQHILFDKQFDFNISSFEQTGILWLPLKHYEMLRQQSVKCGLKAQFHQLQAQLRLSFIHKKIK